MPKVIDKGKGKQVFFLTLTNGTTFRVRCADRTQAVAQAQRLGFNVR